MEGHDVSENKCDNAKTGEKNRLETMNATMLHKKQGLSMIHANLD
jgi:hypothetical protein